MWYLYQATWNCNSIKNSWKNFLKHVWNITLVSVGWRVLHPVWQKKKYDVASVESILTSILFHSLISLLEGLWLHHRPMGKIRYFKQIYPLVSIIVSKHTICLRISELWSRLAITRLRWDYFIRNQESVIVVWFGNFTSEIILKTVYTIKNTDEPWRVSRFLETQFYLFIDAKVPGWTFGSV